MNFILSSILIGGILVFSQQCGREEMSTGTPDCVREVIADIAKEEPRNPPAKVYSYLYEGKRVFYVPAYCCDFPSKLYDENCNVLCAPDGGFSGSGDGKCPDFFDTRTAEKLVWEDPRE